MGKLSSTHTKKIKQMIEDSHEDGIDIESEIDDDLEGLFD